MTAGPLDGYRVVDICRASVGHWATAILADYGASVVSVVEPGYAERATPGLQQPALHGRNQRSILLNLRFPAALDIFFALVRASDALLESNRPGVARRLGIDYRDVREVNPGIVYCALSAFGQTGPYAQIPAHDLSIQGVSGLLAPGEDGPIMPDHWIADWHAAHYAVMAILMGLLERRSSGQGQYIDVSFADASLKINEDFKDEPMTQGMFPCYNIYRTADDRFLTLSIQEPWFWERFCRTMKRDDWISQLRPSGDMRLKMLSECRAVFRSRPLGDWVRILTDAGVPFGPINMGLNDLTQDPQIEARRMIVKTGPVTGESYRPGFALKFSRTPGRQWRGPTALGSDTDDVLAELGYTPSAVSDLRAQGAIG
jgi:crotonobetainyl-CoA:carnitine CoA-transferase CaiB-like acyl-CoA transferase